MKSKDQQRKNRWDSPAHLLSKGIGSYWFRRFVRDCQKLSDRIRFRRIKYGFYRIYWIGSGESAYIGECFKEMPQFGYEREEMDMRIDTKKYRQEYEDSGELARKIKNFVEGYWENLNSFKTKVYMLKNNKEFRKDAIQAYRRFIVK